MKLIRLFPCLALLVFFSCAKSPEQEARDVLFKSMLAHDGLQNWDKIASIAFQKSTIMYLENDSIESESEQLLEFRLDPFFEGKMSWTSDGLPHVVNFNGSQMSYIMGENQIKNQSFLAAKRKELDAAYFAFALPWKLLDEGATLAYQGKQTLENFGDVEVIKASYGEGEDIWWFYIDQHRYLVSGYKVQTSDHISLVENSSYTTVDGFVFISERESFRVDENNTKLYKRAHYTYSDYQVNLQ